MTPVACAPYRQAPSVGLPGSLGHAGEFALASQLAQAHAAQTELAIHRTRTAAAGAAGVGTSRELRLAISLGDHRFFCHAFLLSSISTRILPNELLFLEREAQSVEKSLGLFVVFGSGDKGDVHAAGTIDLVVFNLGEDELFLDAGRVVALAVK